MNIAMILAGGTGTRLGEDIPKQYIEVSGRPIIAYCLDTFQKHSLIDRIVVVAAPPWHGYIGSWIETERINKFIGFAPSGSSRQQSIVNGMAFAKKNGAVEKDSIIIHDAARPNISPTMISQCLSGLQNADGVMPVLPVKDTMYLSADGQHITSLLNRDQIFAGQAPESFCFGKYMAIHDGMTEEELAQVRGSSELAYRHGMTIQLISGDEHNYKITTKSDLEKFRKEMGENA